MNTIPSKEVFEEVAQIWGTTEYFIEKDWYAVQVICAINRLNYPNFETVFSGGTCLSKAYRLIERFSEDIDFRVKTENISLSKSSCSNYKKAVINSLVEAGFSIKDEDVRARNQNKFFEILIKYQTLFPEPAALRPHILLEVTLDCPSLPILELPVKSFISESMKGLPEVPKISCMSSIEIAADKLSAITWRIPDRIRGSQYDDPTLVRHIHDLAKLEAQLVLNSDFHNLVLTSFQKDDKRSKNNTAFSGLSVPEKFKQMFDVLEGDDNYSDEYNKFVMGNSYATHENLTNFKEAKKALKRLSNRVIDYIKVNL